MQIQTENSDVIIAGGVESMSTAPYYVNGVRHGLRAGNTELRDPNTASQPGSQPTEDYEIPTMGLTAEHVAEKYNMTREEQDTFALQSQKRAKHAIENGLFKEEIVPYTVKTRKSETIFDTDEHPRDTSMEKLGKLWAVFKKMELLQLVMLRQK